MHFIKYTNIQCHPINVLPTIIKKKVSANHIGLKIGLLVHRGLFSIMLLHDGKRLHATAATLAAPTFYI